MIARATLLVAALACAECSDPRYGDGHLACATTSDTARACPEGFYCAATDQKCWRTGTGPDLGSPGPDLISGGDLAGADLGPQACAGSTALLCDDFEAATLDAKWQKSTDRAPSRSTRRARIAGNRRCTCTPTPSGRG